MDVRGILEVWTALSEQPGWASANCTLLLMLWEGIWLAKGWGKAKASGKRLGKVGERMGEAASFLTADHFWNLPPGHPQRSSGLTKAVTIFVDGALLQGGISFPEPVRTASGPLGMPRLGLPGLAWLGQAWPGVT